MFSRRCSTRQDAVQLICVEMKTPLLHALLTGALNVAIRTVSISSIRIYVCYQDLIVSILFPGTNLSRLFDRIYFAISPLRMFQERHRGRLIDLAAFFRWLLRSHCVRTSYDSTSWIIVEATGHEGAFEYPFSDNFISSWPML